MQTVHYIVSLATSLIVTFVLYIDHTFIQKQTIEKQLKVYTKYFIFTFVSSLIANYILQQCNEISTFTKVPNVFVGEPEF